MEQPCYIAEVRHTLRVLVLLLTTAGLLSSKDALPAVSWPPDKPLLQFTISKVNHVGGYQGQQTYILDLAVQNMSGKRIPQAEFTFYLFDKQQVRIGQGISTWRTFHPMRW